MRSEPQAAWAFLSGIVCWQSAEAVQLLGVPILPPVDIVRSEMVQQSVDVVDLAPWLRIMEEITLGLVFFLHCGTPCNTFTSARKDDGGPPPLRSLACPMGLSDFKESDQWLVLFGNLFLVFKDC